MINFKGSYYPTKTTFYALWFYAKCDIFYHLKAVMLQTGANPNSAALNRSAVRYPLIITATVNHQLKKNLCVMENR